VFVTVEIFTGKMEFIDDLSIGLSLSFPSVSAAKQEIQGAQLRSTIE